jgi:flagellin-like protein
MSKKALSPIIATIILILLAIIIAIIILLWANRFVSEALTKEVGGQEMGAQQACSEVVFSAEPSGANIDISNTGDVPIYGFEIKKIAQGTTDKDIIYDKNIGPGLSGSVEEEAIESGEYNELEVIPIILVKSEKGKTSPYVCEDSIGKTIQL